jgi:chaperonin cofactor prefoldin
MWEEYEDDPQYTDVADIFGKEVIRQRSVIEDLQEENRRLYHCVDTLTRQADAVDLQYGQSLVELNAQIAALKRERDLLIDRNELLTVRVSILEGK